MSSFLTLAQKSSIDAALDCLHDTFCGDIHVYVEESPAARPEASYNALYGRTRDQSKSSLNKILTKYTYQARIKYTGGQKERSSEGNLIESLGEVRIKVKSDACEKIKIASKIEISNVLWVVVGDPSIEGMFSDNYYTIYLNREN